METKKCTKCGKIKNFSEFSLDGSHKDNLTTQCKECCKKYQKENGRNIYLKSKYGITELEYEIKLKQQNGVCAICGEPETKKNRSSDMRPLSIDHDHKTGKVRGLLCSDCNTMLGYFNHDISTIERAIAYVENDGECLKDILDD